MTLEEGYSAPIMALWIYPNQGFSVPENQLPDITVPYRDEHSR